jgi:hypothetical protein
MSEQRAETQFESRIYGHPEKIGNKLIDKLIIFYVNYRDD